MNEAENVTVVDQVRIHHCCVIDQLRSELYAFWKRVRFSKGHSFFFSTVKFSGEI